ncbi:MAG: hypothetical protein QM795_15235 [Pseudoxanthomonas sp.]
MDIPQHIWRFPTADAIASLASRFQFVVDPLMQDPEVEFSDPQRIDEFLAVYEGGDLTEDEQFLLMEILLNSFEFAHVPLSSQPQWPRILELLDRNIRVHIFSVLAFSDPGSDWTIGHGLLAIASKHRAAFGLSDAA